MFMAYSLDGKPPAADWPGGQQHPAPKLFDRPVGQCKE
jgi:hypothetical protein